MLFKIYLGDGPLNHLLKRVTVSEPSSPHSDILFQTKIFNLMEDCLRVVLSRAAVLIRLDGANVRRLSTHEILNKGIRGCLMRRVSPKHGGEYKNTRTNLDLITSGGWSFLAIRIRPVAEQGGKELVSASSSEV